MYIVLESIIDRAMIQRALNLYDEFHHVGAINKKVFEYKMTWDSIHDAELRRYLSNKIAPIVKKKWQLADYHFTNVKIREYPTGTFYERHVDFHKNNPRTAYLSFSIVLNDEFVGGEFILEDKSTGGKKRFDLRKGEAIIFEGTDYHEVLKITKGHRMSLIGHLTGDIY